MMSLKVVILFLTTLGLALAEPPATFNGYAPRGWRPSGPVFRLPERTSSTQSSYSVPQGNQESEFRPNPEYGAPIKSQQGPQDSLAAPPNIPAATYGPPQEETTTALPSTTTESEVTTIEAETVSGLQKEEIKEDAANTEEGVYYIYHPTGILQKVTYITRDDQPNMAFSARLKYENVEPINNPVYTYDPETFVFKQIH